MLVIDAHAALNLFLCVVKCSNVAKDLLYHNIHSYSKYNLPEDCSFNRVFLVLKWSNETQYVVKCAMK